MENQRGQHGAVLVAAEQAADKGPQAVILSEAKNLCSCKIKQLQRSFVACGSSG